MPYVFLTSYIPNEKANEAAKVHLESIRDFRKSVRGLTKVIVPNAEIPRKDCLEVVGVHDVKEGNLERFLMLQAKDMTNFLKVEGYRYTIEVRFKLSEALKMIGLKAIEPD